MREVRMIVEHGDGKANQIRLMGHGDGKGDDHTLFILMIINLTQSDFYIHLLIIVLITEIVMEKEDVNSCRHRKHQS